MIISLDEEIRKDREQHRHHDKREAYRNRSRYDNSNAYHQNARRPYYPRVYYPMKKRNYEERSSPINKQKSIVRVSNLHYSVTKEQLEDLCGIYGKVKSCKIDWDKMGRSNETASIEFFEKGDQQKALNGLNGMRIQEQTIKAEILVQTIGFVGKKHAITKSYGGRYGSNKFNRRN